MFVVFNSLVGAVKEEKGASKGAGAGAGAGAGGIESIHDAVVRCDDAALKAVVLAALNEAE